MSNNYIGTVSELERLKNMADLLSKWKTNISANLRVAWPGIIASFDSATQTVEVDLALQDRLYTILKGQNSASWQYVQVPRLTGIPIVLPRAGGFTLTMPVTKGDECLVIISDVCINAWWQNGALETSDGYIGQQWERPRRHDFSDGMAILGVWSQPRVLSNYSTQSAQLRSDDGSVTVDVTNQAISLNAPKININSSGDVDINAQGNVNIVGNAGASISGNKLTKIEGKTFLEHMHTGVQSGGSESGPVF